MSHDIFQYHPVVSVPCFLDFSVTKKTQTKPGPPKLAAKLSDQKKRWTIFKTEDKKRKAACNNI